jgi:hypothetical protein
MTNTHALTDALTQKLNKYGAADFEYLWNFFTAKQSDTATISGSIGDLTYKVMIFDASEQMGIASVSAHFILTVPEMDFSEAQMAFWNADNRFTKIYRQDEEHAFLVFDTFLPSSAEGHIYGSIAKIWSMAVDEVLKLKLSCERQGIF